MHPRDAEAWLGLAASYDRLRRFDLADRAYAQAIGIVGPTAEILNNQGYSYMLRGDYKRARAETARGPAQGPAQQIRGQQSEAAQRELAQGQGGGIAAAQRFAASISARRRFDRESTRFPRCAAISCFARVARRPPEQDRPARVYLTTTGGHAMSCEPVVLVQPDEEQLERIAVSDEALERAAAPAKAQAIVMQLLHQRLCLPVVAVTRAKVIIRSFPPCGGKARSSEFALGCAKSLHLSHCEASAHELRGEGARRAGSHRLRQTGLARERSRRATPVARALRPRLSILPEPAARPAIQTH